MGHHDLKESPEEKRARRIKGLIHVQKTCGELTATTVFKTGSSDPKHPLYSEFEHDKESAWYNYNLAIANDLIRMYKVDHVDVDTGQHVEMPVWINLHSRPAVPGGRPYDLTESVLTDEDKLREALVTAKKEIIPLLRRWKWHPWLSKAIGRCEIELSKIWKKSSESG